jgi:hypothetical protein
LVHLDEWGYASMFKTFFATLNDEINRHLETYLHRKCTLCGATWDQRIAAHKARAGDVAPEAADDRP